MKKIALLVLMLIGCTVTKYDAEHVDMDINVVTSYKQRVKVLCEDGSVRGCAKRTGNKCQIYSIADICVLQHEFKHCMGWKHPKDYSECN